MATQGLEIYSINHFVPEDDLLNLLKLPQDYPTSELSAFNWEDKEVFIDELATFFPFPKYFNREWDAVKECVVELCTRGRVVMVRGITPASIPTLEILVDYAASLFGAEKKAQGRVIFVLIGFASAELKGHEQAYPVSPLEVAQFTEDTTYRVQVSGKRNHTYYVNLALKVFMRRDWYTRLELSGLGNAIPSIVSVAEILKRYKVAVTKSIQTSLVELSDGEGARPLQKAKIVVILAKISSTPTIMSEDDSDQVV